jgi:hypothetical protein
LEKAVSNVETGPREALESNCREALNASCIKRIPAQYLDCYLQSAR